MQSDAPPTRAAAPSPALFSCTAAAVSRRAARPRPLVSRTPLLFFTTTTKDDDSLFSFSRFDRYAFFWRTRLVIAQTLYTPKEKKRALLKFKFKRENTLLMGSLFFLPKTRRFFFFFGSRKKQEERTPRQIDFCRKEGKAALRASLPSKVVSLSLSLFVKSQRVFYQCALK